jgi:hypothetical protein
MNMLTKMIAAAPLTLKPIQTTSVQLAEACPTVAVELADVLQARRVVVDRERSVRSAVESPEILL